jgi:hypothetical protein
MADAVCPFCQNTGFEVRAESLSGLSSELPLVRCSACGAPVSVLQTTDVGQALNRQDEQIRALSALASEILRRLADIDKRIGRLQREPMSI